jgi:hypothetical protein
MKNYTEKFKVAYEYMIQQQQKYLQDHDLMGKSIYSEEHPDYFAFDKDWKKIREKLDTSLLRDAYYQVGDKVLFVKNNTYNSFLNNIKKDSLKSKKMINYTVYDREDDSVTIENPNVIDVYYRNELSIGVISSVKTSDSGSGEILYNLKDVIPAPPEMNPYILEKDIITINEDNLGLIETLLIYINKNNDNN